LYCRMDGSSTKHEYYETEHSFHGYSPVVNGNPV
jgi:hypothetical protein